MERRKKNHENTLKKLQANYENECLNKDMKKQEDKRSGNDDE